MYGDAAVPAPVTSVSTVVESPPSTTVGSAVPLPGETRRPPSVPKARVLPASVDERASITPVAGAYAAPPPAEKHSRTCSHSSCHKVGHTRILPSILSRVSGGLLRFVGARSAVATANRHQQFTVRAAGAEGARGADISTR